MKHKPTDSVVNHFERWRVAVICSLLWMMLAAIGCGGPAQIGANEEALKAVDALYTAVSTRRIDLLDGCAAKIDEVHSAGKMSDAAFNQLKPLIVEARSGQWEKSLRQLYDFMRRQQARRH